MLHIQDSLYFGQYEVSNQEWRDFLDAVLSETGDTAFVDSTLTPDNQIWDKDCGYQYGEPLQENYFWHPAFDNYPVNAISYEQVEKYISWRNKELAKILKDSSYTAYFRLPTQVEWMDVGLRCLSQPEEKPIKKKKNAGEWRCDCKSMLPIIFEKEKGFPIYNMQTNVAEMVTEKGLALGGYCQDGGTNRNMYSRLFYTEPRAHLGVRLVMIVQRK